MDSFVVLAADSNLQTERRNSAHRLYDLMQVTDHPEAYIAHDPCFEQRDRVTRTVIPLHMSVESAEREHLWDETVSNEGSLVDSIVETVTSIGDKIVEKLDTFSLQHKEAQKQILIPSERIPVANDVIKAQYHEVSVPTVPIASRSVPLAVPREKVTIHLDQAKDLSAINQRSEFSKTDDNILHKPLQVIGTVLRKPLETVDKQIHKLEPNTNVLLKPLETVDKQLHKSLDPHTIGTGLSAELDSDAFDREFEATVV